MVVLIVVAGVVAGLLTAVYAALALSGRRFVRRLQTYSTFSAGTASPPLPAITYAGRDEARLRELHERYSLENIAGAGSDADRAIALMRWVHGLARHASNPPRPPRLDALFLIRLCTDEKRRLNCWLFATILNDIYLSLGFASRIVHLYPFAAKPRESHVVTCVYLRDVGRWALMDPDMRGFIVDEQGIPLGVREVRERLAASLPLAISDDIDMAHVEWLPRPLHKALYRWYLSKNCFRYNCPVQSEPDYESRKSGRVYVEVIPDGYRADWLAKPRVTPRGNTLVFTSHADLFWAPPR